MPRFDFPRGFTTRFAPAPTGYLHLGHLVNAVWVWGLARACGGRVLLRIEDHDRGRCRPEYERALLDDLAWLGFLADAPPMRQSENLARYTAVLGTLEARNEAYACVCSRSDIAQAGGEDGDELRYPGTCRAKRIDLASTTARRIVLGEGTESFDDARLGRITQRPAAQCGDVLARDRNGNFTYQFAVTVDDADQRVDVVIRGEDLLESTGRQLALARIIGRTATIRFLHHPLVRHDDGRKLSKSAGDTGIRELRAAGATPQELIGRAAAIGGTGHDGSPLGVGDLPRLFG